MSDFKFDYRIASYDANTGNGDRFYCIIERYEDQPAYINRHSDPESTNLIYLDLDEVRNAIKSMEEALDKPIIDLDKYPNEL